jgi:hypothetical protein
MEMLLMRMDPELIVSLMKLRQEHSLNEFRFTEIVSRYVGDPLLPAQNATSLYRHPSD